MVNSDISHKRDSCPNRDTRYNSDISDISDSSVNSDCDSSGSIFSSDISEIIDSSDSLFFQAKVWTPLEETKPDLTKKKWL